MVGNRQSWTEARGFLARFARDTRANTLAIMGMALIPLAGMVGGGVDISRMYIVKTRLQHACDAGALAGRKAMGGVTWSQSNDMPRAMAEKFFEANYNRQAYGVTTVTSSFTESAGKVSGTASAELPMTLMKIFGRTSETLTVTCDAEMRLPNTDVMFVLDTTGSMDENDSNGIKKIDGLKVAVKCFYEIVARLDSDATCVGGAPSGGTGNDVQIRFGFVPYATNVNVGRLLKPEWFADSWTYQSRRLVNTPSGAWGTWTNWQYTDNCGSITNSTEVREYEVQKYGSGRNEHCYYRYHDWSGTAAQWEYGPISQNISALKSGSSWNANFTLPIGISGTQKTINWDGCIEERATVRQATYSPIPAGAKDLDIDLVPSSDADSKWAPALPDLIYTRNTRERGNGSFSMPKVGPTNTIYSNDSDYYCPRPAVKMQKWPNASDFNIYVNALTPSGNTYHDIGLLWGARLMSPTGLFASENVRTPKGGEIERHLIFMTDGDTCTGTANYTAYGVAWFDRRQTDAASAPTAGCTDTGTLTTQVNERYTALCSAVKNKNITLWVVAFGNLATTSEDRLEACASSNRYFKATNSADLQATFKKIADQISQLRLTK
jgi:Flp pilus assembly protein TadG